MKDKILKFLQQNYAWGATLITGISIIISFVLKFMKYIYSNYYFNYYGISHELFNSDELGILYNFGSSFLIALCLCSLFYCYVQLFNTKKYKLTKKTKLLNGILIAISNIIMAFSVNDEFSIKKFLINIGVFIIAEIIMTIIFLIITKNDKDKNNDIKDSSNYLKILPFYLMLIIGCFLISYNFEIKQNKSYRIIDDNKVIVYTTKDYYLILDCEIENNVLTIYRCKQSKIDNENIESELMKFKEIKIK